MKLNQILELEKTAGWKTKLLGTALGAAGLDYAAHKIKPQYGDAIADKLTAWKNEKFNPKMNARRTSWLGIPAHIKREWLGDSDLGRKAINFFRNTKNKVPEVASVAGDEIKKNVGKADLADIIKKYSDKYNLPLDRLSKQIGVESSFNPKAVSPAGAQGLMQLMPDTAASLGLKKGMDILNPDTNINLGAKYMRKMLDRFGGDYNKALAAYNGGPTRLSRVGLSGMPQETLNYIKKINM